MSQLHQGESWRVPLRVVFGLMLLACSGSGAVVVPTTVRTVHNSFPLPLDVAADVAGDVLTVSGTNNGVYRGYRNGSVQLIVGSGSSLVTGNTDGVGGAARFYFPQGISYDASANVAYISDSYNYRVRIVHLDNNNVTTLAGSTQGAEDGVGAAAKFNVPWGVVCYAPAGLLYVADSSNNMIRKVVITTANVTTIVTATSSVIALCINRNGTILYATTRNLIVEVSTLTVGATVTSLAGSPSLTGFNDGVGEAALFKNPRGISLAQDGLTLIITDSNYYRIRRLDIATSNVTTIAGNGTQGFEDGLTATFSSPFGAKWYCNSSFGLCGVLVADRDSNAVRFVAIELAPSDSVSLTESYYTQSQLHSASANVTTLTRLLTLSSNNTRTLLRSISGLSPSASTISWSAGTSRTASETMTTRSGSLLHSISGLSASTITASRSVGTSRTASETTATRSGSAPSRSWGLSATGGTSSTTLSRSLWSPTHNHSHSQLPSTATPAMSRTHTNTASLTMPFARARTTSRSAAAASISSFYSATKHQASPSISEYCSLVPAVSGDVVTLQTILIQSADNATTGMVALNAAGISRQNLLASAPLVANLSLTLGGPFRGDDGASDGWSLVGVWLDVLAADLTAPVLLTASVKFTVLSSSVVGRDEAVVVVLRPPNASGVAQWLPTALSAFSAVTLQFRLSLQCPTNVATMQDAVVTVLAPAQVVSLATEVKAASTVAQYSSWLSVPATGVGVGRLSAARGLVTCTLDSTVSGLLSVPTSAGSCEDSTLGSVADDARGAVLGNLVLWAAGCVLIAIVAQAYSATAFVTQKGAVEALGVPSPLLPLVVATVPSTVSGTFVLLRSSCAADIMVGTLGALMAALLLVVLGGLASRLPSRLVCVVVIFKAPATLRASSGCLRSCFEVTLGRLMHRRFRWVARGDEAKPEMTESVALQSNTILRLERLATLIVLEYAAVWYLFVDSAVLTAAGFLGAVSTLGSAAACRGSAAAIAVLYAGQLAVCAVAKPFTSLFSHVHTLFSLTLSTASVFCQVWYLFALADDSMSDDALSWLLTVASVCDIMVSAVSMLRTLMDIVEALRVCRRHVRNVVQLRDARRLGVVLRQSRGDGPPRLQQQQEEEEVRNVSIALSAHAMDAGVVLKHDQQSVAVLNVSFGRSDVTRAASHEHEREVAMHRSDSLRSNVPLQRSLSSRVLLTPTAMDAMDVDAVGINTAREDMVQHYRGAAHDLLCLFGETVSDVELR